jgi:N-acetylneuraminate synthase
MGDASMPGEFRFDDLQQTYMIAEIGINHNGDVDVARKLIDYARVFGWDCVKFQKRTPELCVPESQKHLARDTPWGRMTYLEYRERIELGADAYDAIRTHCGDDIDFAASVWDVPSADFVARYDVPFIKIPSALLTDDELIVYICGKRKPVLLSTGMSDLKQVDHAVELLQRHSDNFALLHCNSTYPASEAELNLRVIPMFRERYGCPVGYSGHEFGLTSTIAAVALGATIVERHVTLKRTMWGTDQMASVEPHGMLKLVQQIRALESSLGDGIKRVYESELPIRAKLRGC